MLESLLSGVVGLSVEDVPVVVESVDVEVEGLVIVGVASVWTAGRGVPVCVRV